MDAGRFRTHVSNTYFTLRLCMGMSALAFPVVLSLGGWIVFDLAYQPSLSDYYYTRLGDVFVGMLIAIGASLTVYAGYSRQEDWLLNLAGVLAVVVALVPPLRDLPIVCDPPLATSSFWHGAAALAFFAAIAINITNEIWEIWHQAPDEKSGQLLRNGLAFMQEGLLPSALGEFDRYGANVETHVCLQRDRCFISREPSFEASG